VHRDVVGLVALDFILWIFVARMVDIPFITKIFFVHLNDSAADVPGLRVPCHMITDAKSSRHGGLSPVHSFSNTQRLSSAAELSVNINPGVPKRFCSNQHEHGFESQAKVPSDSGKSVVGMR
jgi:hypothetical protein